MKVYQTSPRLYSNQHNGYLSRETNNFIPGNSVTNNIVSFAKARNAAAVISFGAKNKDEVIFIGAEMPPYCKKGGVATVMNDYASFPGTTNHMFIPYYNGKVVYDELSGQPTGKAEVHKLPNGTPIYTNADLDKVSLTDIYADPKKYVELEEVVAGTMKWGNEEDAVIRIYKVKGQNHYMVYTDRTAIMPQPYAPSPIYASGSAYTSASPSAYSTGAMGNGGWAGNEYAKFNRAFTELLPNVPGINAATIVCSDSQTAYVPEYMAQTIMKNSNGYYAGMKPTYIGHNLGDGYLGATQSGMEMFVNLGATKNDIAKIEADSEYFKALKEASTKEYFKKIMPSVVDANGDFNPTMLALRHREENFIRAFSPVSEEYARVAADNSKVAPAIYPLYSKMYKANMIDGIMNPLNDPKLAADKPLPLSGFSNTVVICEDGSAVILDVNKNSIINDSIVDKEGKMPPQKIKKWLQPFATYPTNATHEQKETVKTLNKKALLSRYTGAYSQSEVLTGLVGKKVEMLGKISPEVIDNEKLHVLVGWGRGDFQKGLDISLEAFEKFAQTDSGKNSALVIGGELPASAESDNIKNIISRMLGNEKLKGRFVFLDGFAPGVAMASGADASLINSRFEPCGLTDLESLKYYCTPLVTNTQGLAQKNPDPRLEGEVASSTSYKTKHEFFLKEEKLEEIRKAAFDAEGSGSRAKILTEFGGSNVDNSRLERFWTALKKLEEDEKVKLRMRSQNAGVTEEVLTQWARNAVKKADKLKLERELCDGIIVDQMAHLMQVQATQSEGTAKLLFENQKKLITSWDGNAALHPSQKSSAELYRTLHFQPDAVVAKKTFFSEITNYITGIKTTIQGISSETMERLTSMVHNAQESASKAQAAASSAQGAATKAQESVTAMQGVAAKTQEAVTAIQGAATKTQDETIKAASSVATEIKEVSSKALKSSKIIPFAAAGLIGLGLGMIMSRVLRNKDENEANYSIQNKPNQIINPANKYPHADSFKAAAATDEIKPVATEQKPVTPVTEPEPLPIPYEQSEPSKHFFKLA